jgi:methyl-accepting chemotaxis protein
MISIKSLRQSAFASVGVTTFIILIFILTSLFYYLTFNQVNSYNDSMKITSALTSQSVMEKVDRNFYERFGDVQAFAYNKLAVSTAENDSIAAGTQQFINTMTAYYVLYDLMMICNHEGKVLAVNTTNKNGELISSGSFMNKNFAQEDWFKACTSSSGPTGGAWYSDFLMDAAIGKIYGTSGSGMAYAAPIKNAQGTVVGVWYNYASWKEVTEGIREEAELNLQKDHPGAFIAMTRSNGEVISAANQDLFKNLLQVDTSGVLLPTQRETSVDLSQYEYSVAKSKGAYTYAGKNWIALTFIPKQVMSWSAFFSKKNFIAVSVCLLIVALVMGYIFRFFKNRILSRITQIKELQQRLSEGEILKLNENTNHQDEFSQMMKSLSALASKLQQKAGFADEISKGNLAAELEDVTAKDALGTSLVNMRNQLQSARIADQQRNWSAEGLAQIGNILRSFKSTEELYSNIVRFVVTYVKANQGGLFLLNENEQVITLAACYAYEKKKFLERSLSLGQGLVGQCILERGTIHLTEIPKGYITITSGLGGASPSSLLIVPLKTNEEIFGAIEIASFQKFEPYQIAFIENLAEGIAASINSISSTEKTRTLLEQTQQQTEEMKSQEEEMRQNMEELSATQEEMLRKEKEYLQKIRSMESVTQLTE